MRTPFISKALSFLVFINFLFIVPFSFCFVFIGSVSVFAAKIEKKAVKAVEDKFENKKIAENLKKVVLIRKDIDKSISELATKLRGLKGDSLKKFDFISETESKIKSLRDKNPNQPMEDEIYLKTIESALGDLPSKKDFEVKSCLKYKLHLINLYDPQSSEEEGTQEPALKSVLSVLEGLCQ